MPAVSYYANNASSTLNGSITNVATSITLTDGSAFPSPAGGGWFWLTLTDGSAVEIVKVTARASNVLTVVRAQQGTSAAAWPDLTPASHRWTKADADYLNAHAAAHLPGGVDPLSVDHAALASNLAWTTSGHTGTAGRLAGWDGSGVASTWVVGTGAGQIAAGDHAHTGVYAPAVTQQTVSAANTTSNTTGAATSITIEMTAGHTYTLEAVIGAYTVGSTTAIRWTLAATGGLVATTCLMWVQMNGQIGLSPPGGYSNALDTWTIEAQGSGAAAARPVLIHAVVVCSVSGTCTLRFRSETSGNQVDVTGGIGWWSVE